MDKLLTPDQIAEYLGVRKSTIYQWTHEGYIPYVKLGKFVRFKEHEVKDWILAHSSKGRNCRRLNLGEV